MKFFFIICTLIGFGATSPATASAVPYATPDAGRSALCKVPGDPVCGNHGQCVADLSVVTNHSCKCDPKWFTPASDLTEKACEIEKTSQSLAIWLQIFFGWVGVGAFVLNWQIWGAVPFIILGSICILTCVIACTCGEEWTHSSYYCLSCTYSLTIAGVWIATLVYIVDDCYSNVVLSNGMTVGVPCA